MNWSAVIAEILQIIIMAITANTQQKKDLSDAKTKLLQEWHTASSSNDVSAILSIVDKLRNK